MYLNIHVNKSQIFIGPTLCVLHDQKIINNKANKITFSVSLLYPAKIKQ